MRRKALKLFVWSIFFSSALTHAEEKKIMTLVKHFDNDGKMAEKAGLEKRTNEDRGYLVSIEAGTLFVKSDSVYVYTGDLSYSDGSLVPFALMRTPELSLEFDSAVAMEKGVQAYNQRLAQEGGGTQNYLNRKVKARMFLLVKPAGFAKYVHPSGEISKAAAFDAVSVCKRGFKSCRTIKSEKEEAGFFSKILGGK